MKPGWKTSECWHAIIAQGLAFLTLMGVVTNADCKTLEDSIGNCITAIFALVANGMIVSSYLKHRFVLKNNDMLKGVKEAVKCVLIGTAGLALWLIGDTSELHAQSVLPWRNGIQQQLKQHDAQINQMIGQQRNQPQQAPQIIMMPAPVPSNPPLQQFPIQGKPEQTFPIQGQPQQSFPIQGAPQQTFPIQGQPQQQLPIQGLPQQTFPIAPPGPVQPMPIAPPTPAPAMPPAVTGPQTYSIHRALAQPIQ